jgi:hypothetical protein
MLFDSIGYQPGDPVEPGTFSAPAQACCEAVKRGKTPVLVTDQARDRLGGIDTSSVVGLRATGGQL